MNRDENILRGIIEKLKIDTSPSPLHKESLGEEMLSVFAEKQKGKQRLYRTIKLPAVKLAAAAAILIVIALILNIPAAKAIALKQVYDAIDKVDNICVTKFKPSAKEPYQTVWTSRTLNVTFYDSTRYDPPRLVSETGEVIEPGKAIRKYVLWDLGNLVRKLKNLDSGEVTITPFTEEMLAKMEKRMAGSFAIIPFAKREDLPADATWHKIDDLNICSKVPGTEVYDLTWTRDASEGKGFWYRSTFKYFIDPATHLRKRVETYTSDHIQPDPRLGTISIFSHPSDEEVLAMIEKMFD